MSWTPVVFLVAALACVAAVAVLVAVGLVRASRPRTSGPQPRPTEPPPTAEPAPPTTDLNALTSGLAHEIKNPLSTIGLNAQLLAERVGDLDIPDEDRAGLTRRVDALVRETERLRGILTDFLQYAGEPHIEPAPHDLNQIVDELVDFYLPQAERSGVRLRADPAPAPVTAAVDARQLKQAILNLMLNATQAMGGLSGPAREAPTAAGGDLILRTRAGTDARGRPTAEIHVIDTGPGIAAEHRARLFEPYFTTRSGGTGLGLPTTRRLIEAHGGSISVHSELGTGSDFVIELPAASPDERSG